MTCPTFQGDSPDTPVGYPLKSSGNAMGLEAPDTLQLGVRQRATCEDHKMPLTHAGLMTANRVKGREGEPDWCLLGEPFDIHYQRARGLPL